MITLTLEIGDLPEADQENACRCHHVPELFLKHKRQETIEAYAKQTGWTVSEIEKRYESGIDSWIGYGSVTCYELPCLTMVGCTESTLILQLRNDINE